MLQEQFARIDSLQVKIEEINETLKQINGEIKECVDQMGEAIIQPFTAESDKLFQITNNRYKELKAEYEEQRREGTYLLATMNYIIQEIKKIK